MENRFKFTKEKTLMLKGIAIILLLFHHIYYRTFVEETASAQVFIFPKITNYLCRHGAVSIFIFATLSGYGLAVKTYSQPGNYLEIIKRRERNLLSIYMPIYCIGLLLKIIEEGGIRNALFLIYGEGDVRCVINIVMELFALPNLVGLKMINPTMWYMAAAHIIIVAVPLFSLVDRKNNQFGTGLLIVMLIYASTHQDDVFFDCLLVACIGAWLYGHKVLEIISEKNTTLIKRMLELIIIVISIVIYIKVNEAQIFNFYFWAALVMPIMLFFTNDFISKLPYIRRILVNIGSFSSIIFMTHTYLIGILSNVSKFVYSFKFAAATYLFVLGGCIVISLVLKKAVINITQIVHSKIQLIVK